MPFTESSSHGLLPERKQPGWKHVKNLDLFYRNMYHYYSSKGLEAILLSEICAVISLGFTIFFSIYLIAFLNWSALLSCTDESTCAAVNSSLSVNPFRQTPTIFSLIITLYFIIFFSLLVYRCTLAVQTVSDAYEMEEFYREQLGIPSRKLHAQTIPWHHVVDQFVHLHETGQLRVAVKDKLNVQDIILRIMRKENYIIALLNKHHLDLQPPWWLRPFFSDNLYLTKSMEWSLSYCITEQMFTDQFDLSVQFVNDLPALRRRFQVVGLVHFLMLPFMLVFMTTHFFLQNAQQFHSNRAYLGPRQWSAIALWTCREFNELPHFFEERMSRAYTPALTYLTSFSSPHTTIVARCSAYVSGAFVAVLLLISVLSEGALLHVHVLDRNLLWYLGIFSALFAASRALVPDDSKQPASRGELLQAVGTHTHWYPREWVDKPDDQETRETVAALLPFKSQLFVMEVLSAVLTPAILCFSLPDSVPAILGFIRQHTTYVDGVGAVCDYSFMPFDTARSQGSWSSRQPFSVHDGPNDDKLAKSVLNFHANYPNVVPSAAAQPLKRQLDAYKNMKRWERDQTVAQLVGRSVLGKSFYGSSTLSQPAPGNGPLDESVISQESNALSQVEDLAPFAKPPTRETSTEELAGEGSGRLRGVGPPRPPPFPRPVMPVLSRQASPYRAESILQSNLTWNQFYGSGPSRGPAGMGERGSDLPSVLLSVLKQQDLNLDDNILWFARYQHERAHHPAALERSLLAFAQRERMQTESPPRLRSRGNSVEFKLDGMAVHSPGLGGYASGEDSAVRSDSQDIEMASL